MKTCLVTGGEGFIGRNFLKELSDFSLFDEIVSIDYAKQSGSLENSANGAVTHRIDLRDSTLVFEAFREFHPSLVVHFAAETHVDKSIEDPVLFAGCNYMGTANVLEAARLLWEDNDDYERRLFVYVSTDEVYGSHLPLADGCKTLRPFCEESRFRPTSPYAASKAAADLLVGSYWLTYKFPVTTVRFSNVYGPWQSKDKFIPKMIEHALVHERLPVYGDGLQMRDWLYVDDACSALQEVVKRGLSGEVYNVCAYQSRTNLQVVSALLEYARTETGDDLLNESLIQQVPDRPGHDLRYDMSSEKIRRQLGWCPQVCFEDGLLKTLRWYLAHRET